VKSLPLGVYTFSFSSNGLFGIETIIELQKKKLPRPEKARGISVVVAVALIVTAFIGNMELNIDSFYTFLQYLVPAFAFVAIMLNRSLIIRLLIDALEYFLQTHEEWLFYQ
jgi:hypothetical protein